MVFAPKEIAASIGWETRNNDSSGKEDSSINDRLQKSQKSPEIGKERKSKKRGRDKKGNNSNAIIRDASIMGDDESCLDGNNSCSVDEDRSYYGPQYFGPQLPPGLHCDDVHEDKNVLPPGTIVSIDVVSEYIQNIITFQYDSSCYNIPQKIAITGRARVKALQGEFDILGYRLTPTSGGDNDGSIVVESPSWMSAICIEPQGSDCKLQLSSMEKMICTFELSSPQSVKSISITDRWSSLANDILNSCVLHNDDDDNNGNDDNDNHCDVSRKVMVCGAKGVGKSTMVRYLVNKILSNTMSSGKCGQDKRSPTKVAVLDCDVGQPEFSPPGMVSLTIVSKPLLSPPHAHMVFGSYDNFTVTNAHETSCFYGFTSSKANPMRYMDAVMEAYQCYETLEQEYKHIPLIINTDGWVKGMGYEILSTLINSCRPSDIVQLVGSSKTKFFDLTPHASSDRTIHVVETSGGCIYETLNPPSPEMSRSTSLASMESWKDLGDSKKWQREHLSPVAASFTRSLRIYTYFLGGFEKFLATGACFERNGIVDEDNKVALKLSSMAPLMVPFACLDCFVLDPDGIESVVAKDDLFDTFNTSIVGLCNNGGGRDFTKAGMRKCFGLGVVRSIDLNRQIFYVLTPLKPSYLEKRVTSIVKGQIQLPVEAVYCGGFSESFPHLSFEGMSVGIGCDVMKSKNANIKK